MSYESYEIGLLEQQVAELREQNTVVKAERDEFKRQRDEVLEDMTEALNLVDSVCSNSDAAVPSRVDELRKKHRL